MSDSLIIIPTFNEKENIENIIKKVFSLKKQFNILIVDDNSLDGTGNIVKTLQKKYPKKLFIQERSEKLGLGTAYIHGFNWALKKDYEFVFEMDADFSHNPDDLIKLYDVVKNNDGDLAIGSRYVKGVNIVNWPMSRLLMSFFASKYVKFITGMPVNDSTAGFKCYNREILEAINLDKIQFIGYAFQIEMKFRTWKKGFKIFELPIVFKDRERGISKLNKSIIKEAVIGVFKMQLKSFFSKSYK